MGAKIFYGSDNIKNRVESAKPGDASVYVNMDAIRELPDEYEAIISDVSFDPNRLSDSFSDVSGKGDTWLPQTQLMYDIAEANGISGTKDKTNEPIVEEVDINPMLMKPIDAPPTYRKMIVGRRVTKTSAKMTEDGTMRTSSPCTCDYNVWERCKEAWSKEEMYTNGYQKQGQYPPKYDSMYKRKNHFDSEMKFAQAKAETKAYLKTIRELACMHTGYKTEALKEGRLYFCKIRRSREVIKLETAARINSIANGNKIESKPVPQLFAPETQADDAVVEEVFGGFEAEPIVQEPESKRECMILLIKYYQEKALIPAKDREMFELMLKWLEGNNDAESKEAAWTKAVNNIKKFETSLPKEARAPGHGLY